METQATTGQEKKALDVERVRKDFPALHQEVNGKSLVYLDNGATAQTPTVVIESLDHYYRAENSNIHRGVHQLSQKATERYEEARQKVARFINAEKSEELIFTTGTTDGINAVASSFGRKYLQAGDEVLITTMEHHSNIVPWQMICEEKGAHLKVAPINERGELLLDELEGLMNDRTRILAFSHVSNTLGTINPAKEIIQRAHAKGIPVLVDGAQAVPHMEVDVQELDADFYAFSGHKMFGPTGIGILYGKEKWLEDIPPYRGGGEMIETVTFEKTTYAGLPNKFEAGTPPIAQGIAMGTTVDYIADIGLDRIASHEKRILSEATAGLQALEGVRPIGTAREKAAVLSFVVDGTHPSDIGILLDKMGIAVRTGHHCTEPLMDRYGITGTVRASFALYNNEADVERLIEGLKKVIRMLK